MNEPYSSKALRAICQTFGVFFCIQWAGAVLLFPLYKQAFTGYVPVGTGFLLGGLCCLPGIRRVLGESILHIRTVSFLGCVLIVGFVLRVLAMLVFPLEPVVDDKYYHGCALNLLAGKEYGTPSARALYPPGMSLLLTAWYWLTTPTPMAGKVLNCLFGVLMIGLIYDVGRRILTPMGSRWAALITAVMPTLIAAGATLGYEIVLAFVLLAVCDLFLLVCENSRRQLPLVGLIGILLGAGCLLKPICLLLPPLLCVAWLLLGLGRRAFLFAGLCGLVMACVIAPWTERNYRVLGAFVPISTNGGMVLYAANNSASQGMCMLVDPLPGEHDEVSRDRIRQKAAIDWILGHPLDWGRLAVAKAVYTWGTSSTIMAVVSYDRMSSRDENACKAVINVFWSAVLAMALFATVRTGVWQRKGLLPLLALLAYVFTLHLFYEALSRHHIPVLAALILVAAAGAARVARPNYGSSGTRS